MNTSTTIPPVQEIAARLAACRDEMTHLKTLMRLADAAAKAEAARARRALPCQLAKAGGA